MKKNKIIALAIALIFCASIQQVHGMQIQEHTYNTSNTIKMTLFQRLICCLVPCVTLQTVETIETVPLMQPNNASLVFPKASTSMCLAPSAKSVLLIKPENALTGLQILSPKLVLLAKQETPTSCFILPCSRLEDNYIYFETEPTKPLIHAKNRALEIIKFEKIYLSFDRGTLIAMKHNEEFDVDYKGKLMKENKKIDSFVLSPLAKKFWTMNSNIKILLSAQKYTPVQLDAEGISVMCGSRKVELLHYNPHEDSNCDSSIHDFIQVVGKTYEATERYIATRTKPVGLKLELITLTEENNETK